MANNSFPWTTFSGDPTGIRTLVDAALTHLGAGWTVKWPPDFGQDFDPEATATVWLENPPWVFPPPNLGTDEAKQAFRDALLAVHPGSSDR